MESVCDKSLCDPCDPDACNEFWEPNLLFRAGIVGTAKPFCSLVCVRSDFLEMENYLAQVFLTARRVTGIKFLLKASLLNRTIKNNELDAN